MLKMQNPFALRRRFGDSSKSKSLNGEKSTAKSRAPRGPLLVMVVGAVLVFCHSFVEDYAQAIVAPDGLYIPDSRHVVPPEVTTGDYAHTFRLYNARPYWVSVEAQPDCGCTSISWEKTRIAPFAWKDVTASLKLKKANSSSVAIAFKAQSASDDYLFAWIQNEK